MVNPSWQTGINPSSNADTAQPDIVWVCRTQNARPAAVDCSMDHETGDICIAISLFIPILVYLDQVLGRDFCMKFPERIDKEMFCVW